MALGIPKIEVGDWVKILDTNSGSSSSRIKEGTIVQVKCISYTSGIFKMFILDNDGGRGATCDCGKHMWVLENKHVQLVEKGIPDSYFTSGFSPFSIDKDWGITTEPSWSMLESLINIKEYKQTKMSSSFTDKMSLMFKSEPEKSYRKAGIINGDDIITDQGAKIFLTWLLKKNPEFKAEVVDPILAEDAK